MKSTASRTRLLSTALLASMISHGAAKVSLQRRGDGGTGWSMAWKVNS